MGLFKSRQGAILWRELPEFMRLFDRSVSITLPGQDESVEVPGDLQAYLLGFGHVLDRFESTLAQFYADGFMVPDPMDEAALQMQSWLVPYFADLFGVTLYGPDPDSRRSELSQSIWVARRRGTKLAIDMAAESILQRAIVAVPGLERVVFTPSLNSLRLTHEEITGIPHVMDNVILHQTPAGDPTHTQVSVRHAALPLGLRDSRRRMRAVRTAGFRLDTDSRLAFDDSGDRSPTRFRVEDLSGAPCFPFSYEDRALRTPDIRAPRPGRRNDSIVSRPDSMVLHVDPPPGFFDETVQQVDEFPLVAQGDLEPHEGLDDGATPLFMGDGVGDLRLDPTTGSDASGHHDISGLLLNGTLVVSADTKVTLRGCAVRNIIVETGAELEFHNGICDDLTADAAQCRCMLEFVTVMGKARFRMLQASDSAFMEVVFTSSGPPGCLRYCRVAAGNVPKRITETRSSSGPVSYLHWPCLPDPLDNSKRVTRQAVFGEPGYGVLSPLNALAVATGAEDGGEIGAYHDRYHLARLSAATSKAEEFAPAGTRVFARYDLRSAAPLPKVQ